MRWLIALVIASLISYALFAAVGQLIGTLRYNNPSNNRPAISINFMPIYKNEYKQTPSASPPTPAPAQSPENDAYEEQGYKSTPSPIPQSLENNTYKEQGYKSTPSPIPQSLENNTYKEQGYKYKSAPLEEKRRTETPPEPKPLSITKHTPANRGTSPIGLQPIYRVEPIYPMYAITRGIEGWVSIEFAITMNGKVVNPKVIASDPPQIFEQTTLMAITQWRYPPGNKSKSSAYIKFELRDD